MLSHSAGVAGARNSKLPPPMSNVNVISVSESEYILGFATEVIVHGLAITAEARHSARIIRVLIAHCL